MASGGEEHIRCDLCGAGDAKRVLQKKGVCYAQCQQCGFVYADPPIADYEKANEESYVRSKPSYIDAHYSPEKQRVYRRVLRQFEKFRQTNQLLEIGSNVGGLLYQARKVGWEAVGVEPVASCASYARQAHGLNVIASTIEQADLPDNTFDVVYSNAVFEHLLSPSRVARKSIRVLRPGGVMYTNAVNYNSYTREILGADWKLLSPSGHPSLFTPETLQRFCAQAGLKVLSVRSRGVRSANGGSAIWNWLKKPLLSVLSRFTLKGDRIIVLAQKPA